MKKTLTLVRKPKKQLILTRKKTTPKAPKQAGTKYV